MLTNRNIWRVLLEVLAEWEEEQNKVTSDNGELYQNQNSSVSLVVASEEKQSKVALSVKELSNYLGISTDSIYSMVREKQIPHVRVRRRILFYKESIDDWLRR